MLDLRGATDPYKMGAPAINTQQCQITTGLWLVSTSLPAHDSPSPVYPCLHAQEKDPGVLVHVA